MEDGSKSMRMMTIEVTSIGRRLKLIHHSTWRALLVANLYSDSQPIDDVIASVVIIVHIARGRLESRWIYSDPKLDDEQMVIYQIFLDHPHPLRCDSLVSHVVLCFD